MAASLKFDLAAGSQVINTVTGILIRRPCVAIGVSTLMEALTLPGCPDIGDGHPDRNYSFAVCVDHQLRSIDRVTDSLYFDILYRSTVRSGKGGTADSPIWSITDASEVSHIVTAATADGSSPLVVAYTTTDNQTTYTDISAVPTGSDPTRPAWAKKGVRVHKIKVDRILRVQGAATAAQWNRVKKSIRAMKGAINNSPWGDDDRGTWLFLGPTTRTDDLGNNFTIDLTFINDAKGFYPIGVYIDPFGNHPPNSVSESNLRASGLPDENGYVIKNGLSAFSVYPEEDFGAFDFTP